MKCMIADVFKEETEKLFDHSKFSRIVGKTLEAQNVVLSFTSVTRDDFKGLPFVDDEFLQSFENFILKGDDSGKFPPNYDISRYYDVFYNLENMLIDIGFADAEELFTSRRYVIEFPKEHCFQSIVFLFRHDRKIVCSVMMRSCDAYSNFLYDLFIAYMLAVSIKNKLLEQENFFVKIVRIDITFFITSFHVYLKDFELFSLKTFFEQLTIDTRRDSF